MAMAARHMSRMWRLRALQTPCAMSSSAVSPLGARPGLQLARHGLGARSFAAVPAALVKELRDRTGASMGKCRQALSEEEGDLEKAVEWLRKKGIKSMEKRAADTAAEALLALHVAADASGGAVVELRAETDFVTRGETFQRMALCLAHTAARAPASTDLQEVEVGESAMRPENLKPGTTVAAALLETGSIVGERFVLGQVSSLPAPEGCIVGGYVHPKDTSSLPNTGRMAALVAVRPVGGQGAPEERLREVAGRLARHIVAAQPRYASIQSVPANVLAKEREAIRAAHLEQLSGRKAGTIDEKTMNKVLDGKTQRFYSEAVLLCQEFIGPLAEGVTKPPPVAEWLESQARDLGLEKLIIENFHLASL